MGVVRIRAGDLRHRVAIQSRASGKGTRGQATGAWSTIATVPCSIKTLAGREAEQANKLVAAATLKVEMRYYAGLTVKHRLLFGSREINIGHVDNVEEQNIQHVLLCAEDR